MFVMKAPSTSYNQDFPFPFAAVGMKFLTVCNHSCRIPPKVEDEAQNKP